MKRVLGPAPCKVEAGSLNGAFSEMYSRPAAPKDARSLRPNIQATPKVSRVIQWQPLGEAWMDDILTLESERRIWGSGRSGLLGSSEYSTLREN